MNLQVDLSVEMFRNYKEPDLMRLAYEWLAINKLYEGKIWHTKEHKDLGQLCVDAGDNKKMWVYRSRIIVSDGEGFGYSALKISEMPLEAKSLINIYDEDMWTIKYVTPELTVMQLKLVMATKALTGTTA